MTEKEALSRLDRLLKRPRSDAKAVQARAIAAQEGDPADKVIRIELLDQLPSAPAFAVPRGVLLRPEKSAEVPPPVPPLPARPSERESVARNRESLLAPVRRGKLWAYLTKEYAAMVRFGVDTATLQRGLIPFTLRLTAAAVDTGQSVSERAAATLSAPLTPLLKKAWTWLTIPEYNLLAALAVLSETAQRPQHERVDPALLAALLLFRALPNGELATLAAWERAAERLGSEAQKRAGAETIRALLSGAETPSFLDVVRARLALQSRRAVPWAELQPEGGPYLATQSFDCTPEVQLQIDKAIEGLHRQREALDREFLELRRIHFYLPDPSLLDSFVGIDRSDRFVWSEALLDRVNASVAPLLGGQVVLAEGAVTLFNDPTLTSLLARLDALHGQRPAKDDGAWTLAVGKMVLNLGKLLVVVIRTRSQAADPLVRAASVEAEPLPHEQALLVSPTAWVGLSVIEALVQSARLCLLAGRFLGETSLDAAFEREPELEARAARVEAELARLSPH